MKVAKCKTCGKDGHYKSWCFENRKPIAVKKRIPQAGDTKRKWLATRSEWLKTNLPDYRGYYKCHYCGKLVNYSEITLDHRIPRSRAPHLRYDHDNLVPSCYHCNLLKGSVAHDEYAHACHML